MSKTVKMPQIKKSDAESTIRDIATTNLNAIEFLDHASMRMQEREITVKQVLSVLKCGEMQDSPEWDTVKEKGWKCRFKRVQAGNEITVSAKLVERNQICCLIVTVF